MPSHPVCLRSILILSTYQFPCLPSGLFPSGFPTKSLYAFLVSSIMPHGLILPDYPSHIWLGLVIMKLPILQFLPFFCYFILVPV